MEVKWVSAILCAVSVYGIYAEELESSAPRELVAVCEDKSCLPAPRLNGKPDICPRNRYLQAERFDPDCPSSYTIPATVAICAEVPFFAKASFLYWYVAEEGLSVATNGVLSGQLYLPSESTSLFQSFEYKPGFKAGLGYTFANEWTLYAEYTWLHGSQSVHRGTDSLPTATAGTASPSSGTGVWAVSDWFLQTAAAGGSIAASDISSKWNYEIDLWDLTFSRPSYFASMLIVTPYAGVRGMWMEQKMRVSLSEAPGQGFSIVPLNPIASDNSSTSWAIGPRMGTGLSCLLSRGFRIEADTAASLLYTRFTEITHEEDPASLAYNPEPYKIRWNEYNCVRAIAECSLGLGWGEYWHNEAYRIDFAADYSFSYLWGQNMIRTMLDETLSKTASAASDMYFHGLTFTARLDF